MATPAQPLTQQPDTIESFAGKVRAKYPDAMASDGRAYKDIPDVELVDKVVQKHPVYTSWLAPGEHMKLPSFAQPGAGPRLAEAVKKAGVTPQPVTQFEQEREPERRFFNEGNYGFTPEHLLGSFWEGIKNVPGMVAGIPKAIAMGIPSPGAAEAVEKEYGPLLEKAQKAEGIEKVGRYTGLATAPLGGAWATAKGEQAGKGDIGGAATEVATTLAAPILAAKAAAPVARPVTALVKRVAEPITRRFAVPDAPQAMRQAIQPGMNIPRAGESIEIAGPRLQQVKATMKGPDGAPFEYKSPADVLEGVKAAKSYVYDAIEQRMGPVAELKPDTSPIADAMEKSITGRTERQFKSTADAIRKRAETYRTGDLSLREIEESIQDANNELRNFYKRPAEGDSPVGPQMAATQAEVQAARKLLDQKVEDLSGAGVKDLKREYGALRDVERASARAHAVATRQKGATLWEGLAALHAAGDFLSGNAVGALKGAGVLAIGRRLKNLRDPNFLIDKAFQGDKAFKAAPEIPPAPGPNIKGALPAPPTELPGPADTSGSFRGGRWTTPAAQLTEGEPIKAKFIREIPKERPGAPRVKGLLGTGQLPESNIPPIANERTAVEGTGRIEDATRLGARGREGTRAAETAQPISQRPARGREIKGELPAPTKKGGGPTAVPLSKRKPGEVYQRPIEVPPGAGKGPAPTQMAPEELAAIRKEAGKPNMTVEEAHRYRINKTARAAAESRPAAD